MKIEFKNPIYTKNDTDFSALPKYLFGTENFKIPLFDYYYYIFLLFFFRIFILLKLNLIGNYKKYENEKDLNNKEVEKIYEREARTYEKKHHITTNFRDTWWRRQIGMDIVSHSISTKLETIKILDVATGIGLSVEEMLKISKIFNKKFDITAIDYNQKMLNEANAIILPRLLKQGLIKNKDEIQFERADARNLRKGDLKTFSKNNFDCITTMFGIGGIDNPIECLKEQLSVLKVGGIISIIDIHQPVLWLEEKWPFFIFDRSSKGFNILAWEKITKPIVLGTLWGWRDTTILFYIVPFLAIYDEKNNKFYSFKTKNLEINNERWWFNLPVISTGKIVAEKIEISKEEFNDKNKLFLNLKM